MTLHVKYNDINDIYNWSKPDLIQAIRFYKIKLGKDVPHVDKDKYYTGYLNCINHFNSSPSWNYSTNAFIYNNAFSTRSEAIKEGIKYMNRTISEKRRINSNLLIGIISVNQEGELVYLKPPEIINL